MANKLKAALTNTTRTENGALSNKSTLNPVLDLFYHSAARRGQNNTALFTNAFMHDQNDAILTAFYVRDVRGGQGERDTFRQYMQVLADSNPDLFVKVLPLIPEYGRWDDVIHFVTHGNVGKSAIDLIAAQLALDIESKTPSLLAKWLPSENASSKKTVARARYLCGMLGLTVREYRVMLSDLRKRINVVERLMSAKQFDRIEYAHVPSRAAMIYRKAFHKRDGDRYREYLAKLQKGETKINSGTLYPYELTSKSVYTNDATLDAQWNALPDYTNGKNALAIVDVSGSMSVNIPGTNVQAMDVAVSIGLYLAERSKGAFNGMFITFDDNPRIMEVKGKTLHDKVNHIRNAPWGGSTNLQAALDLILNTAVRRSVPQEDMPTQLIITSDMQFNVACNNKTNLDVIRHKYQKAGYTMPNITFWNVMSRKEETPALADDNGVYLVGGMSPSIFNSVLSSTTVTPEDMMYEVIHGERYARVAEALKDE